MVLTFAPTTSATILLYDHNTINHNAQTALNNLGLTYTIAGAANFNTLLTGSAWDLVVLDMPSTVMTGGFDPLIAYIGGGGRAILSYWDLDDDSVAGGTALASAFGVTVASSVSPPQDVYSWDPSHAIWAGVSSPLSNWDDNWADDGDKFALGGVSMLGGFTLGVTAGEGAIGLGNGGRTIVNGFLFDELGSEGDGIRLIENEISYLTAEPIPEPGTMLLLGSGLAGMALRRRRRRNG